MVLIRQCTDSHYSCNTIGIGGNGHTIGNKCAFPFMYNNIKRDICITDNNSDVHWCYTVNGATVDSAYANCDVTSCRYGMLNTSMF